MCIICVSINVYQYTYCQSSGQWIQLILLLYPSLFWTILTPHHLAYDNPVVGASGILGTFPHSRLNVFMMSDGSMP